MSSASVAIATTGARSSVIINTSSLIRSHWIGVANLGSIPGRSHKHLHLRLHRLPDDTGRTTIHATTATAKLFNRIQWSGGQSSRAQCSMSSVLRNSYCIALRHHAPFILAGFNSCSNAADASKRGPERDRVDELLSIDSPRFS